MNERIDLHVAVEPGAISYGDHCHNGRQLVVGQLVMLRLRAGAREGDTHETRRDLSQAGGNGVAHIESSSSYRATVKLPGGGLGTETADHTTYGFDAHGGTVTAQEFGADGQPLGDPVQFADDAQGDAALGRLHTALSQANNAPEVPAV